LLNAPHGFCLVEVDRGCINDLRDVVSSSCCAVQIQPSRSEISTMQ
jgi:hypothetical protein